jgi:hypothetical protein
MKNVGNGICYSLLLTCLIAGFSETPAMGQPESFSNPRMDRSMAINSIANLRVAEQSEDGTELTLVMQYTYNGHAGANALLVPIIDRKDQPSAGGWFGADMVTVPAGSGPVSIKVKFFNDEPGVPQTFETDRVRVLILNHSGSSIIGGKNLLKTVQWGREDAVQPKILSGPGEDLKQLIQLADEAEDRARNQARLAAEAEAVALKNNESSANEQQKTDALLAAGENARIKAGASARATEAALIKKEQKELLTDLKSSESMPKKAVDLKTRITNVEIVNRSRDRSRMTLGIEFESKDKFDFTPLIGAKIQSSEVAGSSAFFKSTPVEVGRRKQFVLLPVEFAPPGNSPHQTLVTDKIIVYVTDESGVREIPMDTVTLLLAWRTAGAAQPVAHDAGSIVLQEFRQRNGQSGYATVKYHLPTGSGQLRVRVFDSSRPESVSWFETDVVTIGAGHGLELVPVGISGSGGFPGGEVKVDTVEVELLGESGQVLDTVTRLTAINWSREQ